MDACLSCFGLGRSSDSDDDQEPLLPNNNSADQDRHAQVHKGATGGMDANGSRPSITGIEEQGVAYPTLEKLVDIVAAFKAGKLPTQDQITRIFQVLLNSDLLKDGLDQGAALAGPRDGTGPTSLRGVRALQDLRAVFQAALEFSAEKNDDNKIQDFFHQLSLLNATGVDVDFNFDTSGLPSFKVAESLQAAASAGKESVSGLKDEVPTTAEISNDAAVFAHALRTILQTILTSTVFRYILIDVLGILRDLAVQGATDIEEAAAYVESVAAGMEKDLDNADLGQKLDETVEEIQKVSTDHILGKGRQAFGLVSEATQAAKHKVSDKTEEWGQRRAAALYEAGDDVIARVQQVLVRAQEDPASRRAMRAIILLVRKYSDRLEEAGNAVVDAAGHAVEEVVHVVAPPETPNGSGSTSEVPKTAEFTEAPPSALPDSLPRRVHVHTSKDQIGDPVKFALIELKGMLERMGRGHSLDGVLRALADVVKDLKELPVELGETVVEEVDQKGKSKFAGNSTAQTPSTNIFRAYFNRIGGYLDRAMDHPGWVRSKAGSNELEELFMEGLEILNVVGEVADDVGSVVIDGQEASGLSVEGEDHTVRIRQQFARHVRLLWKEFEMYLAALEKDRTTMKLWKSTNELAGSIADLLSSGPPSVYGRKPSPPSIVGRIRSSLQWTEWLGWALPRLIHLIPLSAIPIPSLEARSETGGWQAGLYALFVKGEAARNRARMGRLSNPAEHSVLGGIQTTLVPDEIVFKEWTEVRIDMADGVSDGMGRSGTQPHGSRWQNALVDTTSRIRVHVDGIRARIDGLGYYLQYGGSNSWIGYEDEGILNVDVGMGYPHAGLGCDVEIEVTKESSRPQYITPGKQKPVLVPPSLAGEGVEGEGEMVTVPEIFIDNAALGKPQGDIEEELVVPGNAASETPRNGSANLDVQGVVEGLMSREREHGQPLRPAGSSVTRLDDEEEELEPLFKVVDVQVQMEGVHVELQRSRHWILNKLLVQPLAGPTIHQLARMVLADKIREVLGSFALELAKMSRDAHAQGETRRERTRRRKHEARVRRIENLIQQGRRGIEPDLVAPYEEEADGFWDVIGDWGHAVIECGSRLISQRVEQAEEEDTARVDTGIEATLQGVIIHSSTAIVDDATEEGDISPPMVFNKQERRMEPTRDVNGNSAGKAGITDVSDITVAVGGGAQLFPGKQVPYGDHNDAAPVEGTILDRALEVAQDVTAKAEGTAKEAVIVADQVEARFEEDLMRERGSGWTSKAFDF